MDALPEAQEICEAPRVVRKQRSMGLTQTPTKVRRCSAQAGTEKVVTLSRARPEEKRPPRRRRYLFTREMADQEEKVTTQ